jgi:hypothetical protein
MQQVHVSNPCLSHRQAILGLVFLDNAFCLRHATGGMFIPVILKPSREQARPAICKLTLFDTKDLRRVFTDLEGG